MPETSNNRKNYTSNADLQDIADRLRRGERITITTHVKPDGDAIGSSIALARTLDLLGKETTVVYHGPWPHRFDEYTEDVNIIHHSDDAHLPAADLVVITDTGAISQLQKLENYLKANREKVIIIDHHRHGSDIADVRYIEPEAPAVCEPMAELCRLLLQQPLLPVEVATPLFIGIAMDTGWFRFNSVRPQTMHLAADLIEAGVDHSLVYRTIEQGDDLPRLELMRRALDSLELLNNNASALMVLRSSDIEEAGAHPDDTSGLIDVPQTVAAIRLVCLVVELKTGKTKISLRSKPGDHPDDPFVNVDLLAGHFGGGGHVHAAGAKVDKPVDEVLPELRALLDNPADFTGLHRQPQSRLEAST
ncbi:MAG TPA: hypothetical protein ENJ06_06030 [Phycisphaeraceae bacterium]|nr:hypothetical protein [Phycisphaeraceae bacterium]